MAAMAFVELVPAWAIITNYNYIETIINKSSVSKISIFGAILNCEIQSAPL
jgi:hypothetical protein